MAFHFASSYLGTLGGSSDKSYVSVNLGSAPAPWGADMAALRYFHGAARAPVHKSIYGAWDAREAQL